MNKYQFDEYVKCLKDKTRVYFIENYLSTFNADERKQVPFKLFPRQKVYLNAIVNNSNVVTVKHRQCGITTVSSAWITGQLVFASAKSPETVLCIGNKKDISEQLVEKIGTFLDQVPRWMWGDEYYSPDPDSPKNTKTIYKTRNRGCIELFNGCKVHARSSGENAARGISAVSILIFDEAAFIQNGTTVYAQAVAATASVSNSKILMVSTPNGKDPLYWKTYDNAVNKTNNFQFVEFKWYQDLRYNRYLEWHKVDEETGKEEVIHETIIGKRGEIEYNEERWRKLEREGWKPISPWYIKMCKSFNNDSQKIAQELDISFLGSSDTVVPVEVIEKHRLENVIEITDEWNLKDTLVKETWIWKDPIPGHRYICACLPAGEQVLTNNGYKNVENVKLNDILINKEGYETKIKRLIQREYNNTIYGIKLKNFLNISKFTDNHPIWSSIDTKIVRNVKRKRIFNFDFNKASTLSVGDWVEIPNTYKLKELNNKEILDKWNEYKELTRKDFNIINPLLKEEFWYYCGMWLAEGYIVKDNFDNLTIHTSHNINEYDIHNRLDNIITNIFNRKPYHINDEEQHTKDIKFSSKQIGMFLLNNFGKYAHNKEISTWIKYLPVNMKLKLIEGYLMGDGSILKNNTICYVSVSQKLLEDIQDILFSVGIVSSLKKHNSEYEGFICGRKVHCKSKYMLSIGKYDSKLLLDMIGIKNHIILKESRRKISNCYLSNDKTKIYVQISMITQEHYKGTVYNFETTSHTFCAKNIATHNCDPSSGSGEDATAIEVIDVDAVDENGIPCFEQVLEYNGKLNGSDVGQLVYRYASIYNNALAIVEAIGGYGDSVILTLQELKYSNLYYDDTNLKNYTNDSIKSKKVSYDNQDQLPGFRSNALRLQMISNFIEMLKNNSFKVRSSRVISELGTWIFKNGRPDHMDGMHDDLLTCLSMGLFVMQFYMLKSEKNKKKDATIVASWYVNNQNNTESRVKPEIDKSISVSISAHYKMNPFVNEQKKQEQKHMVACIMLGGYGRK